MVSLVLDHAAMQPCSHGMQPWSVWHGQVPTTFSCPPPWTFPPSGAFLSYFILFYFIVFKLLPPLPVELSFSFFVFRFHTHLSFLPVMPKHLLAIGDLTSGVAVAALPGDSDDSGRQNIAPMDTEDTGGSNAGTANAGAAGFVTRRPRTSGKKGVVPGPPPVDYKPSGGRKGPPPPPPVPLSRVALAKSAAPPANSLPKLPDLSGVKMENQHVYQIPEEVRMEIFELRTKFKFSNAELAAAVGRSGGANPGQAVGRFLNATGESGDQKQIYTPLAHFVEKMRIYEKRPKSQKRKQLEKDAERRPGKKPLLVSDLKTTSGSSRGAMAPAGAGASA